MDTIHAACEHLWEVDPTMVFYPYPGKIQHSAYVIPYEKKHTRVPQLKKYRKMSFTAELRRYSDQVFTRIHIVTIIYYTGCRETGMVSSNNSDHH